MPARYELVNLYYLGGLKGEPGQQVIATRQRAFILPKEGGFVQLQNHLAEDVMRRYPGIFTTNVEHARRMTGKSMTYRGGGTSVLSVEEAEALLAEAKEAERVERQLQKKREEEAKAKEPDLESRIEAAEEEAKPTRRVGKASKDE